MAPQRSPGGGRRRPAGREAAGPAAQLWAKWAFAGRMAVGRLRVQWTRSVSWHGGALARVQVAATPFGPSLPGFQMYHTSVLLDGVEYSFGEDGVMRSKGPYSHVPISPDLDDTELIDFGLHTVSAKEFEQRMMPLFRKGTYDLLRKNCNAFSACALFLLAGEQLDARYSQAESLGSVLDGFGLLRGLTVGLYQPNELAEDFDKDAVIRSLCEAN